jgi:predicted Fe-S protein YdhL (DUF1289 family)
MAKIPNPCIDVCKYKRQGHCIGCGMTKAQKSLFKQLKKPAHKAGFVTMLMSQQQVMGKFSHWRTRYAKKCAKRGLPFPPKP